MTVTERVAIIKKHVDQGTEVATSQIIAGQCFDISYVARGNWICEDWSTVELDRQDAVWAAAPKAQAVWAENPKTIIIAAHSRGIVEVRKCDWGGRCDAVQVLRLQKEFDNA